jgi:hypothetical protein
MNLNPLRKPAAVDLDELEARIHDAREATSPTPIPYAPRERVQHTPLQVIGHAITRLTYKDAVKMGEAIQAKLKEGELTAAIQEWAADWEKFADAIGPRE